MHKLLEKLDSIYFELFQLINIYEDDKKVEDDLTFAISELEDIIRKVSKKQINADFQTLIKK